MKNPFREKHKVYSDLRKSIIDGDEKLFLSSLASNVFKNNPPSLAPLFEIASNNERFNNRKIFKLMLHQIELGKVDIMDIQVISRYFAFKRKNSFIIFKDDILSLLKKADQEDSSEKLKIFKNKLLDLFDFINSKKTTVNRAHNEELLKVMKEYFPEYFI